MKLKLYLDTTIPSSYFDTSKPVRQLITEKWFENESQNYQLFISPLIIMEIERLKNQTKKENIKGLILEKKMSMLDFNDKAMELANQYMRFGAIPKSEPEDAYHIAIATVHRIDLLASWNFSHIVSINPIRKIHDINQKNGYHLIEIASLELFGGYKYGNL